MAYTGEILWGRMDKICLLQGNDFGGEWMKKDWQEGSGSSQMDENLPSISFGVAQTAETKMTLLKVSRPSRCGQFRKMHFPGEGLVGLSPPTCNVTLI